MLKLSDLIKKIESGNRKKIVAFYRKFVTVITIFIVLVGSYLLYNFIQVNKSVKNILVANYKSIDYSDRMISEIERQDSYILEYVFMNDQRFRSEYIKSTHIFIENLELAGLNLTEKGEKEIYEKLKKSYGTYLDINTFLMNIPVEKRRDYYFDEVYKKFSEVKEEVRSLRTLNQNAMIEKKDYINQASTKLIIGVTLLITIFIIFILLINNVIKDRVRVIREGIAKENIKRLKEISDLKSEFIGVISHEFKTPLTSMEMAIGILSRTKDEKQKELLGIIKEDHSRLKNLIMDLLDITKIESGAISINSELIITNTLLKNLESTFKEIISAKGTVVEITNEVKSFSGDIKRVTMVLNNLFSNSIKYGTEKPGDIIKILVKKEKNNIVFSVINYGLPIPEEDREKIFEKFQRLTFQNDGKIEGTGLGLNICKKIVEAWKGKIGIKNSNREDGTEFYFTIPQIEGGKN